LRNSAGGLAFNGSANSALFPARIRPDEFCSTFSQEHEMKNFKPAAMVAASVAVLAISASAFASQYSDAMSAARGTYRDDVAKCKQMTGGDRASCMSDAKATRHTAVVNARLLRSNADHQAQPHNEGDEPKLRQ
jgi:hypothetical protein